MSDVKKSYKIDIEFSPIKLPPVSDILILGKKYPQGKNGVIKAFNFIAPDEFEMIENIDHENVEGVLINKKILKKIPKDKLLEILEKNIYPFMHNGEAIKVDLNTKIILNDITGEF